MNAPRTMNRWFHFDLVTAGDVAGQAPARVAGSIVVRIPTTTSSADHRTR